MGHERYWDGHSWTTQSRRYESRTRRRTSLSTTPP
ncbi:hypothetical protein E1284_34450, partial [Actinomadura bangladeshensis]